MQDQNIVTLLVSAFAIVIVTSILTILIRKSKIVIFVKYIISRMTQVRKNFTTNILSLLANIIVGIFYTPYLVKSLGVTAYGIIPLALLLNQYVNILATSLTRAITRFYSVEYKSGNLKKASVYFSSSIIFTIVLAIALIPLCSIPICFIDRIFQIPEVLVTPAKVLFLLSIISFFLSVITNCINITIFAENRLDLINFVKIYRNLTKLVFNVLLFYIFDSNLIWVGASYLLSELFAVLFSVYAYKTTKPYGINASLSSFDLSAVKPIFTMIAWVALISFADTFIYKIDSVLVTNYFGLEKTGMLGSMSEFGSYCISLSSVIGSIFAPLVLISYSENNHEDVKRLTISGGYVVGLLTCLMCGLVIGSSKNLLSIWLTPEISANYIWMIIKLSVIPFTTIGGIYATVYNYWNKVKLPAIISLLIALGYVLLSIILLENGVGIIPLLILNMITVLLQGFVMNSCILVSIYKELNKQMIKSTLKLVAFLLIVSLVTLLISNLMCVTNMFMLLVSLLLSGLVSCFIMFIFLSREDIETLDLIIPIAKFISRRFN